MTNLIGALILALVLAPALASAECAWVLWAHLPLVEKENHSKDTPFEAYETRSECEREKGRQVDLNSKMKTPENIFAFQCLPDTVDPRGPKGGK